MRERVREEAAHRDITLGIELGSVILSKVATHVGCVEPYRKDVGSSLCRLETCEVGSLYGKGEEG